MKNWRCAAGCVVVGENSFTMVFRPPKKLWWTKITTCPKHWPRFQIHLDSQVSAVAQFDQWEYPHKIWPNIWYSTSILGSWNSHWFILWNHWIISLMVSTYPSEKWWSSSVGLMKFPIYGKQKSCSKPPTSYTIKPLDYSIVLIYWYTYIYKI